MANKTKDSDHLRFGKRSIKLPANHLWRKILAVALIIGGIFGFLPVLGFWMLPLGLYILAYDSPKIRRFNRIMIVKVMRRWRK